MLAIKSSEKRVLAITLARGGSKAIKNKKSLLIIADLYTQTDKYNQDLFTIIYN